MKDWHAWVYYCLYVWLYVCMTVWLYYCLHDCMYSMTECMYTCTVVYMHICMTVWFYVCMNICMYDCMYSSISGLYNVPVVIFRFEIIAPKCCIFICKNGSYNNYDGMTVMTLCSWWWWLYIVSDVLSICYLHKLHHSPIVCWTSLLITCLVIVLLESLDSR